MRPFFPPRSAQPGNNPSPQQLMQFNPNQFPPGSNQPQPRPPPNPHGQNAHYPTPQTPNFSHFNQPPVGHPQFVQQLPAQNMNQVIAAAALQLLQQQNNPQIPVQMQNNNLAAALVQMAGMLGAQNMQSYQSPLLQQQMYPQSPMMVPSQQYPQQQGIPFQCLPAPQQGLPFQHSQKQRLPFQHSQQQQQQPASSVQAFSVPPSSQPGAAANAQVRPFQCPQQQQQPASSVQSFSVPPSSHPGAAGNAQVRPSNTNLNPGNGMVPNQGQGIRVALASTGQNAMLQDSMGVQNLQPVAPTDFPVVAPQPWMNMQMSGQWRPPVNHVLPDLCHLGSKDPAGKFQGYGRGGPSNMRGRNQTPYGRNQRGNMGPSARNGGQGRRQQQQQQQRGQNRLKDYNEEPKQEFPKFKYTEKEVTEWREARKRNYPSKATGKKRFVRGGKFAGRRRKFKVEDEETKLRREQLKEILAKQSELGVEVAEVPRWYLTEPKERIKKPHPKKARRENEASTSKGVGARRPPTLLEKLHEPEIMRDKSRVLQVLKFMALNNFFEQPNEPLKFPVVMLEGGENGDRQSESEGGDEEVAERVVVEDEGEVAVGDDVKGEDKEVLDKPEEGEITE